MVPTDYRLDHVTARLIERLEGSRRSFIDDHKRAEVEFRRIAEEQVEAAIEEFSEVALSEDPEAHGAFLRREIVDTFLPRYLRIALEMNGKEERGFGFGKLSEPIGMFGLIVAATLVLFVLLRFIYLPFIWPLVLIDMSLPFWPAIASVLVRRRYTSDLEAIVDDMARIQEQANAYIPASKLRAAEEPSRPRPPRHDREHN